MNWMIGRMDDGGNEGSNLNTRVVCYIIFITGSVFIRPQLAFSLHWVRERNRAALGFQLACTVPGARSPAIVLLSLPALRRSFCSRCPTPRRNRTDWNCTTPRLTARRKLMTDDYIFVSLIASAELGVMSLSLLTIIWYSKVSYHFQYFNKSILTKFTNIITYQPLVPTPISINNKLENNPCTSASNCVFHRLYGRDKSYRVRN